ncbi:SagB/ThcOx family dehydrogenase [Thermocrinis sp.]|uniref:SagB/ThcOx family dehydrogenase n=1 Tax=Thermocrinis sp. TaxID=2024383 RepID=UPI0031F312DF
MADVIKLPEPVIIGNLSVEEALYRRRSIREYLDTPLTLAEVSQLLWASQGITDQVYNKYRTAPSAGALYPLTVYLTAGRVEGLREGLYRYNPHRHEIIAISYGDKRRVIYNYALFQDSIVQAPAVLIFTADYSITMRKYGERGIRYVLTELGHASQNVYLQATALGLGTVAIGAFYDEELKEALGLPNNEDVLYLMPVGRAKA